MLTEIQAKFLKFFAGTKASYRRDQWAQEIDYSGFSVDQLVDLNYNYLVTELIELGFLKKNRAGAVMRTKLGYTETGSYLGAEAEATRSMANNYAAQSAADFRKQFS